MKTRCSILTVGVLAALVLVRCGGRSGTDIQTSGSSTAQPHARPQHSVQITLDGFPSAANVGILMASRRGYFEDVGLSVATFTPIAPVRPITYVVDKTVDLSISHLPQVV